MNIFTEINEALVNTYMRTGKPATTIYLGRTQIEQLMLWIDENQYISIPNIVLKENVFRPEVMGCLVYEVNADNHCVAV